MLSLHHGMYLLPAAYILAVFPATLIGMWSVSFLGWVFYLASPLVLLAAYVYWICSRVVHAWRKMAWIAITGMPRVDLFHYTTTSAISLDVPGKLLCVYGQDFPKKKAPVVLPVEVMVRAEAYMPSGSRGSMQVKNTGLLLEFNDLAHPSVFIMMDYGDARKWVRLLSMMEEGKLQPQDKPNFYPDATLGN